MTYEIEPSPTPVDPVQPSEEASSPPDPFDKASLPLKIVWCAIILSTIALVMLLPGLAIDWLGGGGKPGLPTWGVPLLATIGATLIVSWLWAYWLARQDELKEAERERIAIESAAELLKERMELASLVNFNRVLLDKYHNIATDQATRAYRSSRFAMGIGLAILIVAFFSGWRFSAQGDRLFVGSVAAVGTAFTGYLSRTYMQTYERALQQLNQYFNQPVLNSYFLAAERLAGSLPEDRRIVILERIVADVLESGKEMHRNIVPAGSMKANAPKPGRRRRTAHTEASIPAQESQ